MTQNMTKTAQNNAVTFRNTASRSALTLLSDWVGPERAKEAAGRISLALAAAAQSARNPEEFYQCTVQSVAQCVASAALTNIFPGTGSSALAYVVPQRPRKEDPPQLKYLINHRGLAALARRSGQTMVAFPVGHDDEVSINRDGEVEVNRIDFDNPPPSLNDLRGVVVVVKDIGSGNTLVRGWVPMKTIDKRREQSQSKDSPYGPWKKWPTEMAIKTAMHYAISRGWCVIDDADAVRAIAAEDGPIDIGRATTKPDALAALEHTTWSDANGESFDPTKHEWVEEDSKPAFDADGVFVKCSK